MRQFFLLAIRVLVSLALLFLALRGINFAGIQARLSQINLLWIGLAVLVTIFQVLLGALRWREISALCRAPLTDLQAFRYNMIGSFFANRWFLINFSPVVTHLLHSFWQGLRCAAKISVRSGFSAT
jgi:uncharacterized membrane protein YbhN (UPF0104 family)